MRSSVRHAVELFALALLARAACAQPAPSLGTAASFALLAGSSVSNTGPTIVTGNVGASPGASVSGFPPATFKVGEIFRDDATARQAQRDAAAAYADLASRPCGSDLSGQDLGGKRLGPGVYCFSSSAQLTGTLTLDGDGVRIFRIAGNLTTAPDAAILLTNGCVSSSVFWQVGGSATIGARGYFAGTIVALGNIDVGFVVTFSGRALANGSVTLNSDVIALCCDAIAIAPITLPNGVVGKPYEPVTLTASGGTAAYTFATFAGAKPDGLTLLSNGILSGTPTKAGTYNFTVIATDAHGVSALRTYEIRVCAPVIPVPSPLPDATACIPYSASLVPGTGAYTYVVTDSNLPPELTPPTTTTGVLTGTPKTTGDYTFTLTITSACGVSAQMKYSLHVNASPPVSITPPLLPDGEVCKPYRQVLTASCPTTCIAVTADALPPGLTLACDGVLSGMPTTPGIFTAIITATCTTGCSGSRLYNFRINCAPIAFTPDALKEGTVGEPYSETIAANGCPGPYAITIAEPLPPGLTPAISGTPPTPGTFCFTATATDVHGCSAAKQYCITIHEAKPPNPGIGCQSPITITPPGSLLPDGTVGIGYTQMFTASGGSPPYAFSTFLPGSLPPGLILSSGGVISGMPSIPGRFNFIVVATDVTGAENCHEVYTIVVGPAAPLPPPPIDALSRRTLLILGAVLATIGLVVFRRPSP